MSRVVFSTILLAFVFSIISVQCRKHHGRMHEYARTPNGKPHQGDSVTTIGDMRAWHGPRHHRRKRTVYGGGAPQIKRFRFNEVFSKSRMLQPKDFMNDLVHNVSSMFNGTGLNRSSNVNGTEFINDIFNSTNTTKAWEDFHAMLGYQNSSTTLVPQGVFNEVVNKIKSNASNVVNGVPNVTNVLNTLLNATNATAIWQSITGNNSTTNTVQMSPSMAPKSNDPGTVEIVDLLS